MKISVLAIIVVMMHAYTGIASSQSYPSKPIRILTSGAGGSGDSIARVISNQLDTVLSQRVVVENRTSGVILGQTVAKAPPDGYTLLLAGESHWLVPFIYDKAPFDPIADFSPITIATTSPAMIVVNPSLPIHSVKDLIAYARANPGALNFASSSPGTSSHLTGHMFAKLANVKIVNIQYKGAGQSMNDLIGGQVQVMFPSAGAILPLVRSGKVRALAVTSAKPSELVPDMPTATSAGVPGFVSSLKFAFFAPAKTPSIAIGLLNKSIVGALREPDTKKRLTTMGVETVGSTVEDLAEDVKDGMRVWGPLIQDLGIRETGS